MDRNNECCVGCRAALPGNVMVKYLTESGQTLTKVTYPDRDPSLMLT